MERTLYTDDHELFRKSVAEFVHRVVEPGRAQWDEDHLVPRSVWEEGGRQGLVGLSAPTEFGGGGQLRDYRFRQVVNEELARAGAGSLAASWALQDDITVPYLVALADDAQRARFLPPAATGRCVVAIAMTEPGTGSDLRGIRTTARPTDQGWVLDGAKTFITSGTSADVVIVVARTGEGRTGEGGGACDFSLFLVEAGTPGFTRGRPLAKMGLPAQDTAELSFDGVVVPEGNVLGGIGAGFGRLMDHLPLERLSIAAGALAAMQAAFGWTLAYVTEREAFGQRLADFQNTRFRLADLSAEIAATEALVDRAILAWNDGTLTAVDAARAKLWASEAQGRVLDTCVQLHGGYGYMTEYPVARAYLDARVQRIYGGTSEIMREIIGRDLAGRR